jgi:succinate dehydrogenase / fumarate reductase cytochrome b subunit
MAYKWPITMVLSILHRVTGAALYVGTLLIAWWLLAAASSPAQFGFVSGLFGSWFGRLVLFGYTWVLIHHMLGGIRHLVWDTGAGLEKHSATNMARVHIVGSIVLAMLIWTVGYAARGAF